MAERAIQTINNMIQCMLIQSGLPKSFWAEAVFYAVVIHNAVPKTTLNFISPLERMFNERPDHNMIHSFRCEAWRHISDSKRVIMTLRKSIVSFWAFNKVMQHSVYYH